MFIQKNDLGATLYGYQLEQITEGDDIIVDTALAAAEEEIRSYLTGNNQKEWLDGRLHYDVDAILSKTGADRNALIVKHAIIIAKWWIVDLSNVDMIYEQAKERYDRSLSWLKDLASGEVSLSTLAQIDPTANNTQDENTGFHYGSRKKFKHE